MTENLIRILLAVVLYGGEVMSGVAPRYSKGVMERVSRNRDLPLVSCMVSSPYYEIGTRLIVYGVNTDRALSCRVTDVSHPRDRARHIRTKRITELSYEAALALCGRKHINHRPEQCPVIVVRFYGKSE